MLTLDPNPTCSYLSSSSSCDSPSFPVPTPMVNGKMFPKVFFVFFILSENDEDVVCFSVPPAIMVLSVGDFLVATISVEMSDSLTSLLGPLSRWKWQNHGLVLPE